MSSEDKGKQVERQFDRLAWWTRRSLIEDVVVFEGYEVEDGVVKRRLGFEELSRVVKDHVEELENSGRCWVVVGGRYLLKVKVVRCREVPPRPSFTAALVTRKRRLYRGGGDAQP